MGNLRVHKNLIVGQLLQQLRVSRGIPQKELLRRLAWPPSCLSRIEAGRVPVTLAEALLLCAAMQIPLSGFLAKLEEAEEHIRRDGYAITEGARKGEYIGHIPESLVRHIQKVIRESSPSQECRMNDANKNGTVPTVERREIPSGTPNTVLAVDAPGAGGAHHCYIIRHGATETVLQFQHGAIGAEGSTPGVMLMDLLAVCRDVLIAFQSGPLACDENASALFAVHGALEALDQRRARREAAGTLGTPTEGV